MITDAAIQSQLREYTDKKRRLVLGVSGASLGLIKSLSEHYSLPMDSNLFDRVFERNHLAKWDIESLLNLFKDAVDEIEFSLEINQSGVVLNYTPVDAIALLLLHLSQFKNIEDKEQTEVNSIVSQALSLCPSFSHFIQIFPNAREKTISTDLLANLKAGVYNRYYEKLGCVVIHVPELISNGYSSILPDDSSRLDFIIRVIDVLRKTY